MGCFTTSLISAAIGLAHLLARRIGKNARSGRNSHRRDKKRSRKHHRYADLAEHHIYLIAESTPLVEFLHSTLGRFENENLVKADEADALAAVNHVPEGSSSQGRYMPSRSGQCD